MSLITEIVSRPETPANTASNGRLSAQSAMPRGCATQARKDLSELTLAKLRDGLDARGITRNFSQQEGVERALSYLHRYCPEMQKAPIGPG